MLTRDRLLIFRNLIKSTLINNLQFKDLVLSQVDLPQEYMKKDVYLIRWLRGTVHKIWFVLLSLQHLVF